MAASVYTHRVTDAEGDTVSQQVSIKIRGNPAQRYTQGATYSLPTLMVADNERQGRRPSLFYFMGAGWSDGRQGSMSALCERGRLARIPPGAVELVHGAL